MPGLFESMVRIYSLKRKIILWTGCLVSLVFIAVLAYMTLDAGRSLEGAIAHDLATRNKGHIHTLATIFKEKATIIRALRDDLERYETRGQMWVHLAAHVGEVVFDDPRHGSVYEESFKAKLAAYMAGPQLAPDKITPQVARLLEGIRTRKNAYGEGMKFFYIGVAAPNAPAATRAYDEYQDSSLWVPDARVDPPYDPLSRPWYLVGQEAGRERVLFTEPYAERRTGEALVSGGTAIDVEGVRGTLAGGISIKPIMDGLIRTLREDADIVIFSKGTSRDTAYVAAEPKYIYSSRDASLGERFKAYNDPDLVRSAAHRDVMKLYEATRAQESGVQSWTVDGREQLVAFDTVPGVGWKLFSMVSRERLMADALAAQWRNALLALGGLGVLLLVISATVERAFKPLHTISRELIEIAETGDLGKRATVAGDDEVGQMARAVNEMLDNTAAPVRELGRKVKTIAEGNLQADVHVRAKGDIALLVASFNEMTRRLIELEAASRDASPLTGLPGGITIEQQVQRRLEQRQPFAFCLFDLDNFKPFNDRYGYSRGNQVLKRTAALIEAALREHGGSGGFVGHVGGDDFVVLAAPERAEAVCRAAMAAFDAEIGAFYDPADLAAGGITSQDRRGETRAFPIMSMSVCLVDAERSGVHDAIRAGEIAAELKAYAKKQPGSALVTDQRHA